MNYRLIVTKCEENPKFAEEMKEFEMRNGGRSFRNEYNLQSPEKMISVDVLICELTQAQFEKFRAEALKVF